jgi:hypothetical protein
LRDCTFFTCTFFGIATALAVHKILKKVEEHSVQQPQFYVVQPSCCFTLVQSHALAFIELQVENGASQSFNVSPGVHHYGRNLLWPKMLRQKKTVTFFSTLYHTLQSCTCSTPSRYNQG